MSRKWFFLLLVLLTIVNLAAFTRMACRRWGVTHQPQACPRQQIEAEKILEARLDLQDEQIRAMRALRLQFNNDAERTHAALERERMVLTGLLMAEVTDSLTIGAVTRRIDSLQSDLQQRVVRHLLAQKTCLNQDQQKLFFGMVLHACATNSNQCINQTNHTQPKE